MRMFAGPINELSGGESLLVESDISVKSPVKDNGSLLIGSGHKAEDPVLGSLILLGVDESLGS